MSGDVIHSDDLAIPLPSTPAKDVVGDPDLKVAFRFAFLGVGQGGSRIAQEFWNIGYRNVAVLNTTNKDWEELDPAIPRLAIGTDGAGKSMRRACKMTVKNEERIRDFLTASWKLPVDYVLICAGFGGGTGSGSSLILTRICKEMLGRKTRVGALVSLPTVGEGPLVAGNAVKAFTALVDLGATPIIVMDNKRIGELFQVGVSQFYHVANEQVCKLLHLFNRLANQHGKIQTFDRAEFALCLDAGICTFGASEITDFEDQTKLTEAIRGQLSDTLLAEVDLRQGRKAACIFVGSQDVLDRLPRTHFEYAFDGLTRLLAPGVELHRGLYQASGENMLRVYTLVSALPKPESRLQELQSSVITN